MTAACLERQIRKRAPDAKVVYVDPKVAAARSDEVLRAADHAQQIVVAVYVVPSAARSRTVARGQKNSASLPDSTAKLLRSILARASEKTAVLAMGTPYLTEDFPAIQNYICTFSNVTVSEISVAKALFGEIPISGRLAGQYSQRLIEREQWGNRHESRPPDPSPRLCDLSSASTSASESAGTSGWDARQGSWQPRYSFHRPARWLAR